MPCSMLIISVSTFSILFANRAIRGDLRERVARAGQEGIPRGEWPNEEAQKCGTDCTCSFVFFLKLRIYKSWDRPVG